MKRRVEDNANGVSIPVAWRGNCHCGKWLVVLREFRRDNPRVCECGRRWYIDGDVAKFDHSPVTQLPMGDRAIHTEDAMRELAGVLKAKLPASMGFTVFVFDYDKGGTLSYLSTADREDMIGMIRRWLGQVSR